MNRLKLLTVFILLFAVSGCSAYMAAQQPSKKDISVLELGTHRYEVIAELGKPLVTEKEDGRTYDIFKFVQGYGTGNRTLRAIGHGVATVSSFGLWEIVGTPIEGANDGEEVQLKVQYNKDDEVETVEVFKGAKSLGKLSSTKNQENQ